MRLAMTLIALLGLTLATAALGQPAVCDEIDDLSNDWAEIADALERDAGEEVGDLDVERLERDVNELLPDTESLGEFLIDLGNRYEEDLGNNLLDVVDDLREVHGEDFAAYLVDRIDDIVDCLDHVVDYCDAVND